MDHPIASDFYRRTEPGIAVEPVKKEMREAIKSVANKLAIVGDELSQSYEKVSNSGANLGGICRSCGTLECCLDILVLVIKA